MKEDPVAARIRRELEGISQGGALREEKAYEVWQRVNTLHENLVQAFTGSSDSERYSTTEGDLFSDMAKIRVRLHSQMGSYAYRGM